MSNKIVILSGSPRKGATTDKLVQAFREGAEAAGKSVENFRVADLTIGGCKGCGHCFAETGVCVQKDDMLPIYDALRAADAIVLASPVYYFGVTSQLKTAIDRMYALLKEGTKIRRSALLITCGAAPGAAEASVAMYRSNCAFQKWDDAGIIIASGLHAPGDIDGRGELEQARKIGESI
jgi:multimeric flavodoxin WrbA